jgi:hypothetical protein
MYFLLFIIIIMEKSVSKQEIANSIRTAAAALQEAVDMAIKNGLEVSINIKTTADPRDIPQVSVSECIGY